MPKTPERSPQPHFEASSEIQLQKNIAQQLQEQPLVKEQLSKLFNTPLSQEKEKIIGVRCDDLLSTLGHLLKGTWPSKHESPDQGTISKQQNWFYLTPVYEQAYFLAHPELVGPHVQTTKDFHQTVFFNTEIYKRVTLGQMFQRNILPYLKRNWYQKAYQALSRLDPDMYIEIKSERAMIFEDWVDEIFEELAEVSKSPQVLAKFLQNPLKLQSGILRSFAEAIADPNVFPEIVTYCVTAVNERQGVVVGFSESVLQGKVLTDNSPRAMEVIHSSPEMAVYSPAGINLATNSIVAIEALGEYEDRVLKELGLSK